MKAVFLTTQTNDVDGVISAWDYFNEPAGRVTFDHMNSVNDERVLREVSACKPQVIFYIGSVNLRGAPSVDGLHRLRKIAPLIHICFDGGENDWQEILRYYGDNACFDLQVTIDGVKSAAVDLVTVAPVNPVYYDGAHPKVRDIRCGFSGNIGLDPKTRKIGIDQRGFILAPLIAQGLVKLRERSVEDGNASYPAHVAFMRSCRIIINTSFTGSGLCHHVKQRVFESAYAGCALLEYVQSPIADWLPPECYFLYRDIAHAAELIETLDDEAINHSARVREAYVREHYGPEKLYGEMTRRAGIAA